LLTFHCTAVGEEFLAELLNLILTFVELFKIEEAGHAFES